MAGRGGGRGNGKSLTHEQLQALGITRTDNTPTPQNLAPPPLFPKLEVKPLPLQCDAATDYMVIVRDQFLEYLHESPAYVKPKTRTDGIERYSDKYKLLALDAKKEGILNCVWANLPPELRPHGRRTKSANLKRKLNDPKEIAKRLQKLEKKESNGDTSEYMETNENEDEAEKGDDDNEELSDEQEQEEEIDDGTDYANNYFDNGEDDDDEDDNADDGPVY